MRPIAYNTNIRRLIPLNVSFLHISIFVADIAKNRHNIMAITSNTND